MKAFTRKLWEQQDRYPGDRQRLFAAVADAIDARTVLYPGSFVDIAASFVFDDVTYVDMDRRGPRFFADTAGVDEIINQHGNAGATWRFVGADYTTDLDIGDASVDLLLSLYAGFVSEACTRYLRPGGWLLANPSHGDVAMASLNPVYELWGVVTSRSGDYRVSTDHLDEYLIPKRGPVSAEEIRASGRGVGYTKSAFAYLFKRA